MKTYYIIAICLFLVITSCQEEKDTNFLITKDGVGKLKKTSLHRDLDVIYTDDSIVRDTTKIALGNLNSKISIFEKGGNTLLTLTPSRDSIPTIDNIRIHDPRYATENGITINSTFKDIKEHNKIKKVITSMNNLVILLKDSDVYFTISKEELPSSLQYSSSKNIEAVQIPDAAKIKYMMIGWDN